MSNCGRLRGFLYPPVTLVSPRRRRTRLRSVAGARMSQRSRMKMGWAWKHAIGGRGCGEWTMEAGPSVCLGQPAGPEAGKRVQRLLAGGPCGGGWTRAHLPADMSS